MDDISAAIKKRIESYTPEVSAKSVGRIVALGDGVVTLSGLADAVMSEIIKLPQNTFGLVLNLEKHSVGGVVLGDYRHLKEGDEVATTGRTLELPVGDALVGRVIGPLGRPLDGKPAPPLKEFNPLEKIAPGVVSREKVSSPVETGIKAIDSMIPIGRGQRELLIGDRGTGKSALAVTTTINQKGKNLIVVYVVIGQKAAFTAQLVDTFDRFRAMDHTIIVSANASDPAPLQYLAPYAGMALAEHFAQKGGDVLVVFDDLTKHAWAYRELSLLLKRPSGREAYPGDVFYLHSRLLERACRLNRAHGGGSITALPIIETQAGDVSAYIPTNVISITDGQIYLETDLFNAGIRPAINAGLSVSRVGGDAQVKAMRQVAGKLRLDLAQYRELAAFAQFSSDLDPVTRAQLDRGARTTEILKQGWENPASLPDQVAIIWAVTNGYLDNTPVNLVSTWEKEYLKYIFATQPKLKSAIIKEKELSAATISQFQKYTTRFNDSHPELGKKEEEEVS